MVFPLHPQIPDNKKPNKSKLNEALHVAAGNGDAESALLLIKAGADVNSIEKGYMGEKWTPLHLAAQEGHREVGKVSVHQFKAEYCFICPSNTSSFKLDSK